MAWMDERRRAGKPFFACVPVDAPHFPHWVDEKYSRPYEGKGLAGFYGQLANLDENVGRLDAFLRRTGLYANTLLIYMSDNGYDGGSPNPYNARMRGGKCQRYEGGHRVPCFVRWPAGKLQNPSDIDTPAQVQDILPTLIDLCGLRRPDRAHFDGVSLAGLLRRQPLPERMFVVQYYQESVRPWDATVVWGRWRWCSAKSCMTSGLIRGNSEMRPPSIPMWWTRCAGSMRRGGPGWPRGSTNFAVAHGRSARTDRYAYVLRVAGRAHDRDRVGAQRGAEEP